MIDYDQPVLDPTQLKLIQNAHRGFLYQHLYGVAALLTSGDSKLEALMSERDEDQELIFGDVRLYLQIKTRDHRLVKSDIAGALERFAGIREQHEIGSRARRPEFWIISNAEPARSLKEEIKTWPTDVFLKTPTWTSKHNATLPDPWPNIEVAIDSCLELAARVPFRSLTPSTIVWKLAGMIQAASAGISKVSFSADQLPVLLEQFVVQLQKFPLTPAHYRPHESEPPFDSEHPIRLLTGFSGSGKTTWAAQGSQHSGSAVAYFDVGDMPTSGIASQLAREVAAIISSGGHDEIRQVMSVGAGGLQLLVGLNGILASKSISLMIVLDNAHRANADDVVTILKALPSARWIVLSQPWPGRPILEASFGISAESLAGWPLPAIGAAFKEQGAAINPTLAAGFRHLTAGLPLYVQNAARIAGTVYSGDAQKLYDNLKELTYSETTGQEAILNEVQKHLNASALEVAGILSLVDVPLDTTELSTLMNKSLALSEQQTALAIRELRSWGVVDQLLDGTISMHDAFRLIARQSRMKLNENCLSRAREALVSILMRPHAGPARAKLLFTLLPAVGRTDALIDIASGNSELLHEFGMSVDVESMIREAIINAELKEEDRFWAVQTILFWDLQNGKEEAAEQHYADLLQFSSQELTQQQQQALHLMEVLMCGLRCDRDAAKITVKKAQKLADDAPSFDRVLKYNYALTLYHCDDSQGADRILKRLANAYLSILNLRPQDFIGRNVEEIAPNLRPDMEEDAKRFADVLSLIARISLERGQIAAITSINAFKFYILSHSYRSAVKWMQDVVDQLLTMGDLRDARNFIEGALPVFSKGLALDYFVPVYSQYAVILAYSGEIERARRTMVELEPFLERSPEWQREVEGQKRLIEKIAATLPER
jgi:tetratricopeptide (TPR) repeat protein